MRLKLIAPALAALALLTANTVLAGPPSELVFADGVFKDMEAGTEISYSHRLLGQETDMFKPIENGAIKLALIETEAERQVELQFFEGDKLRARNEFPANIGNPLVMAFLETSLRSMANLTGGSPFYIRNRIKDDLRDGGTVTDITVEIDGKSISAQEIRYVPFAEDKNRARMGNFADLELVFVVSDAVPGHFISMRADTPQHESGADYFNEIITLNGSEG